MLWNKLSNGFKHAYSQGLYAFIHNIPLNYEDITSMSDFNTPYWLGYRDMEQVMNEGLADQLTTNEAIYNYCN